MQSSDNLKGAARAAQRCTSVDKKRLWTVAGIQDQQGGLREELTHTKNSGIK